MCCVVIAAILVFVIAGVRSDDLFMLVPVFVVDAGAVCLFLATAVGFVVLIVVVILVVDIGCFAEFGFIVTCNVVGGELICVVLSVGRFAVGSDGPVGIIVVVAVSVGSMVADVPGVGTSAAIADVGIEIAVVEVGNSAFFTDDCVVAVVSVDVDNFQVAVVGGFA